MLREWQGDANFPALPTAALCTMGLLPLHTLLGNNHVMSGPHVQPELFFSWFFVFLVILSDLHTSTYLWVRTCQQCTCSLTYSGDINERLWLDFTSGRVSLNTSFFFFFFTSLCIQPKIPLGRNANYVSPLDMQHVYKKKKKRVQDTKQQRGVGRGLHMHAQTLTNHVIGRHY